MKKIQMILIALLIPVIITACSVVAAEEEPMDVYGFDGGSEEEIVVSNNSLELHMDPLTTQFYVVDKKTGTTWRSNPTDEESEGASPVEKRKMQSLLTVSYTSTTDVIALIDSYQSSVEKGLYEINNIDNGIEVNYTIGDIERIYYMPYAVPESRMNEFTSLMTSSEKRKVEEYYRKYDINRLLNTDDKAALLEKYPDLETNIVYELRGTIAAYLREQLEAMFELYGYTHDDYYNDLEIYNVFASSEKPAFNITVRYELVGNELKVSIPMDKIDYKDDYPIIELNVLPYFGCGLVEDEGYMFVPDGNGGIINYNNGKINNNAYTNSVYGWDEGLYREAVISDNKANFPVFGIHLNGKSMLCVIEESASYANIKADVSGREGPANNVFAQYVMVHREKADISAKSDQTILIFEEGLPNETIVQRYVFCEEPGYVGMAKEYREYLMNKYPEIQKETETGVPVAVELIGAVTATQYRMGLPFDLPLKLTSYKEMEQIIKELSERGFQDVNYRLTGWFNDSVLHKVPTNTKLISELGSGNDFKNLTNTIESNNAKLFLESDFLYMRYDGIFDGFSPNQDAARYITRELVESYPYSFVWYGERNNWGTISYLARPAYMMQLIDNFVSKINNNFNVNNVSFRTIGTSLAGDYNEYDRVSREASMNMQAEKLKELSASGTGVMINNGYAYAVPYADFVFDMPIYYQGFSIIDYEVPFYQIALHGLVSYAGSPINLAEDYTLNLLRSIETGSGLSFSFMKEKTSILQETRFHHYFSNEYDKWIDDATEIYAKFTEDFSDIYNQFITNHTILDNNVSMTEYENGTKVVVNKSNYVYNYNGTDINARDYLLIKGGA